MLLHNFLHQMMNFLLNNIYAYLFIVKKVIDPFSESGKPAGFPPTGLRVLCL